MSDWTTDTTRDSLLETLEQRDRLWEERDRRYMAEFQAIKEATAFALASAQKAVDKAETATEKRLESVNEFRATLADQQGTLISRREAVAQFERFAEQIADIKNALTMIQGRGSGLSAGWIYLLGAVSLVGSLIAVFLAIT